MRTLKKLRFPTDFSGFLSMVAKCEFSYHVENSFRTLKPSEISLWIILLSVIDSIFLIAWKIRRCQQLQTHISVKPLETSNQSRRAKLFKVKFLIHFFMICVYIIYQHRGKYPGIKILGDFHVFLLCHSSNIPKISLALFFNRKCYF